jgi:hypothetical protein
MGGVFSKPSAPAAQAAVAASATSTKSGRTSQSNKRRDKSSGQYPRPSPYGYQAFV